MSDLTDKLDDLQAMMNDVFQEYNSAQAILFSLWESNATESMVNLSWETWNNICLIIRGVLSLMGEAKDSASKAMDQMLECLNMSQEQPADDPPRGDEAF